MANGYLTPSGLRDMGYDTRQSRTNNLYSYFITAMTSEAQNGNLFLNFEISGSDWSIVTNLCYKISTEHPGLRVQQNLGTTPGYPSNIIVRWD